MGGGTRRSARTAAVVQWFDTNARQLPWRSDPRPWPVLVSEVMLQQTPVGRVLPVFDEWMDRWPEPADLAAAAPGEAVRAWGRLGYPRRALRLHAAAAMCVARFGGNVPPDLADLRALPGVGEYTAAAVAAFAYRQRHPVLDTNVRRVQARWLDGSDAPLTPSISANERARALDLLPACGQQAATVSVALMELGALVCTARSPRCEECPLVGACAWHVAGRPAGTGRPRRPQAWHGTDRQCRGRILAALRDSPAAVPTTSLRPLWEDVEQFDRSLGSLAADGLVVVDGDGVRLP